MKENWVAFIVCAVCIVMLMVGLEKKGYLDGLGDGIAILGREEGKGVFPDGMCDDGREIFGDGYDPESDDIFTQLEKMIWKGD